MRIIDPFINHCGRNGNGTIYILILIGVIVIGTLMALESTTTENRNFWAEAKILCQDVPGRDYDGCLRQQTDILKRNQK
jgi:hypothetical protein